MNLNVLSSCVPALRPLILALSTFLSLLLYVPTSSVAGTYKLYSCNVPGRTTSTPSTIPWTVKLDGLHTYFFDECASGGSFGIGLNIGFMRSFTSASLALMRPATGPKGAIGIVRYRTWITAELAGSGAPAFVDEGGAFSPPGGTTADDTPWVSPPLADTNPAVYIRLKCTAGDCSLSSARPLQARGVEVDLYEDVPPTGEIEGGTLFGAGSASGVRTMSVSASDQESGVARVEALIGGAVAGSSDLEAAGLCPHTDLNACPSRHASDLNINLSTIPAGTHAVVLRITDAAGNRRLVTHAQPISVGSVTDAGTAAVAKLNAYLPGHAKTYTTNYGRSARLRGRLLDGSGKAVSNARINLVEQFNVQSSETRRRQTTTGPDGRFSFVLSGRRPSRTVDLDFAGRTSNGAASASDRVRLRVRASSTFRLRLRGVTVRYSGRVVSRPVPRGGKRIYIQGRAVGGAWQRFAVHRTDTKGRFKGRYRLRVRRPGVRLQFRVEIPKQAGYAYSPRVGRALTRVVR